MASREPGGKPPIEMTSDNIRSLFGDTAQRFDRQQADIIALFAVVMGLAARNPIDEEQARAVIAGFIAQLPGPRPELEYGARQTLETFLDLVRQTK